MERIDKMFRVAPLVADDAFGCTIEASPIDVCWLESSG